VASVAAEVAGLCGRCRVSGVSVGRVGGRAENELAVGLAWFFGVWSTGEGNGECCGFVLV
jgi:hypothetical protein